MPPRAYSAFIRHCPFHYNIINDIKDHILVHPREIWTGETRGTSNHDNETNKAQTLFSTTWSEPYRMSDWLFLHVSARTLLNFRCLRVTISYQISWGILPKSPSLGIILESTSRVSPTHYPRWHPCKSQPAKSKSQLANTKVSRQLAGQKGYDGHPVSHSEESWNSDSPQTIGEKTHPLCVEMWSSITSVFDRSS